MKDVREENHQINLTRLNKSDHKHSKILQLLESHHFQSVKNGLYGPKRTHHIACLTDLKMRPVLTQSSKLIFGINSSKSHPNMKNFVRKTHITVDNHDKFVANIELSQHAELACVSKYLSHHRRNNLEGLILWVVRFYKMNGQLANSKPCVGCQSKLTQLSLTKVIHS